MTLAARLAVALALRLTVSLAARPIQFTSHGTSTASLTLAGAP